MEMMDAPTYLSRVPVPTFHLGFLLSTAFVCAVLHLMIVIGEPDLTDAKERDTWVRSLKFLRWLLFLPLGFYNLEQVAFLAGNQAQFATNSSTEVFFWFLGTVIVSSLLFIPIINAIGKSQPNNPVDATQTLNRDPALTLSTELKSPIGSVAPQNPNTTNTPTGTAVRRENTEQLTTPMQQHFRIIAGNFCIGIIMGLSILVPLIAMIFSCLVLEAVGVITAQNRELFLKFTPAITCFLVPLLMPLSVFIFGPSVIRITQGTRKLADDHEMRASLNRVLTQTGVNSSSIELHVIPSLDPKSYALPPAFLFGWPSRFAFIKKSFPSAIFLTEEVMKVMTPAEMEFILAHEVGHYAQKHAVKRILLAHGLFIFGICIQVICMMMHAPLLALLSVAGSLGWGFHALKRQGDLHEFEADLFAMKSAGSNLDAITALKKLSLAFIPPQDVRRRAQMENRIKILELALPLSAKPLDSSDSADARDSSDRVA